LPCRFVEGPFVLSLNYGVSVHAIVLSQSSCFTHCNQFGFS